MNRIKSFLVFLSRNKLYTAVNVVGLGLSLMFVITLSVYALSQAKVDDFQVNKDRIYLFRYSQKDGYRGTYVSYPIAAHLKEAIPEIEETVNITEMDDVLLSNGNIKNRATTLFVDSTFLKVFSFGLKNGNRESVFSSKYNVAITESYARTIFGTESPVGKAISVYRIEANKDVAFTVSAVVEDFKLSMFKSPDIIVSNSIMTLFNEQDVLTSYNRNNFSMFILEKEGGDITTKSESIMEVLKKSISDFSGDDPFSTSFDFMTMDDIYFDADNDEFRYSFSLNHNSHRFITLLSVIAGVILLFAIINYINLSVAQSSFRAKEAATRRLVGGTRIGLFAGYIMESVVLCLTAFMLGVFCATLIEPYFNDIMECQASVMESLTAVNIALSLLFIAIIGIIAGIIPALTVTSFKPIDVVRGKLTRRTKMVLSRVFIVFQYTITIAMIGCVTVIILQNRYMTSSDLGFNPKNVVVLHAKVSKRDNASAVYNSIMQIPGVKKVSLSGEGLFNLSNNIMGSDGDGPNARKYIYDMPNCIDSAFMDVWEMKILSKTGNKVDTGIWLNETAYKELGLSDSDDYIEPPKWDRRQAVNGKVKDFYNRNMTIPIRMIALPCGNRYFDTINIKIDGSNPAQTYNDIIKTYKDLFDGEPPRNAYFADEKIKEWYKNETRIMRIVGFLSVAAVIISVLGLLAMSSYFLRQRREEVAIRKVMGATNREIFIMVTNSFMKMVALAFILAIPIIYYFMNDWLQNFAYRITLSPLIFIFAGLFVAIIAFVSIMYQSYRATIANPVDSLIK